MFTSMRDNGGNSANPVILDFMGTLQIKQTENEIIINISSYKQDEELLTKFLTTICQIRDVLTRLFDM